MICNGKVDGQKTYVLNIGVLSESKTTKRVKQCYAKKYILKTNVQYIFLDF